MSKKWIVSLISILIPVLCWGQFETAKNSQFNTVRTFTPSTPEMALYQRYGEIPVNYNTGIANISIPLASINLKEFNWPISVSYHNGGNKVGDFASTVGLGWVLNAGAYISMKNFGSGNGIDNKKYYNLTKRHYPFLGSCETRDQIYFNEGDVNEVDYAIKNGLVYQPSLSYLNSPNFNLKFIENTTIPVSNFRIAEEVIGGINTTVVTDPNGNRYIFGYRSVKYSSSSCTITHRSSSSVLALSRIETYYGEAIDFEYEKIRYVYDDVNYETKQTVNTNDCARCQIEVVPINQNCVMSNTIEEFVIKKIIASNGQKIVFKYGARNDHYLNRKLESIVVQEETNNENVYTAWYNFGQSYFGSAANGNLRLKLNEIKNIINQHNEEVYSFNYNTTELPSRLSKSIDINGYYNAASNLSLIPSLSDRGSYLAPTQAGVLTRITYPTKGYTEFEYELNDNGWGGLRTKKQTDYGVAGVIAKQRSYKYLNASSPQYSFVNTDFQYFFGHGSTGYVNPDLANSTLELITCNIITEQSTPKLDFIYDYISHALSYGTVEEFLIGESDSLKTVYKFNTLIDLKDRINLFSFDPKLTEKLIYRSDGTTLLYKENNHYSLANDAPDSYANFLNDPLNPRDHRIWFKKMEVLREEMSHPLDVLQQKCYGKEFLVQDLRMDLVALYLDSTIVSEYRGGQEISNKKVFVYNTSDGEIEPNEIVSQLSDLTLQKQQIKYTTSDLSTLGYTTSEEAANNALITANIIAPVQKVFIKGNTLTDKNQVYHQIIQGKALPVKEKSWFGSNNFKTAEIVSYDEKANPQEILYDGIKRKAFRYSAKGEVTAIFENSKFAHTGYASFDNFGNTGFNYNALGVTTQQAYSGQHSYHLAYGAIVKNGLEVGADYLVSYYAKGTVSFSGVTVLSVKEELVNDWKLFLVRVRNDGAGITITGTGFIDDLLLYSSQGSASSYVFGNRYNLIISARDVQSKTSFFTYNPDGKLWQVKDQKGNIVKQYCYNYAGQNVDCNTPPKEYYPIYYARIEVSNINYEYPDGLGSNNVNVTGDVYLKLYEDVNCTIPAVDASAINITIEEVWNMDNGNGLEQFVQNRQETVLSGTGHTYLGNMVLRYVFDNYDPWLGYGSMTTSRTSFSVIEVPNVHYLPKPTIGNNY